MIPGLHAPGIRPRSPVHSPKPHHNMLNHGHSSSGTRTAPGGDMSSLLALLTQQQPSLQTRKALILLGLQNDFLLPSGKLPVRSTAFLKQLHQLVPAFRQYGDIIWVRSEFECDRPISALDEYNKPIVTGRKSRRVDGDDEELFLNQSASKPPACIKGSHGAEFAEEIKPLVQSRDMKIVKSHYSALSFTNLLSTLRSKLITELYVCGCLTNLSVYATAMDFARYGMRIYLVEDCLGYRKKDRHDFALKNLRELVEAECLTSDQVIAHLRRPPSLHDQSDDEQLDSDEEEEEEGEEEETEEEQPRNVSALSSMRSFPAHPYDATTDPLAADSDPSEDEINLPDISALSMRDRRRDTRFSTSRSSRAHPSAGTSPSSHQTSKPRTVDCPLTAPYAVCTSKAGSADRKRKSPTHDEAPFGPSRSPDGTPTRRLPVDVSQRYAHVSSPSKRDFHSMETHQCAPRSVKANAATSLTRGTRQQAQKYGYDAEPPSSSPRAIMSSPVLSGKPLFGEDKSVESEGSRILYDLLPPDQSVSIFDEINQEISWQRMFHQTGEVPRLVCCQGTFAPTDADADADGSGEGGIPVYRHPSDQTLPLHPWTPAVDRVRLAAERLVGHPLNHALIQLYRGGTDFISEHSDKTLDIVRDSFIVNVSFGAQRTMRLRTKRGAPAAAAGPSSPPLSPAPVPVPVPVPAGHEEASPAAAAASAAAAARTTYRIPMPHNSLLAMSLRTNAAYLHGINADKRRIAELSPAETAYGGQRISLTFRHIGTFLSADETRIWGQGAVGKTRDAARPVVNGDPGLSEKLVRAFGRENQGSRVAWEEIYGEGSDVLHLK